MNRNLSDAAPGSSRFVRACLRQPVDRTPVWFLRQAGRYMPEYMAVRRHHSLLEICRTPDLAAEVTITAAERLGVDAAIIFADLLLPFTPMGLDFEFVNGEGPVVHNPVRSLEHVQALRTDRAAELGYVAEAIARVAKHFDRPRPPSPAGTQTGVPGGEAQDRLGIIGFIGAPFTLASYMIEGASSRNYIETKRLMYASARPSEDVSARTGLSHDVSSRPELSRDAPSRPELSFDALSRPKLFYDASSRPERSAVERPPHSAGIPDHNTTATPPSAPSSAWPLLMAKLLDVLTAYAQQQVEAGADVIQIFDSWAGALSVSDYRDFVLGPTTELVRRVQGFGVPVIYFGVDTASLLPSMRETGADVLGLDWRIPLDQGWRAVGSGCAVQGNLDPITLFAPAEVLETRVREILTLAGGRPGHVFNLGHGIVPGTPVDSVLHVVDLVRRYGTNPQHPRAAEPARADGAVPA